MNSRQRSINEKQIQQAMAELALDARFGKFIELLRMQRENAIVDACMESTVASQRASMAAIGEIRMYTAVIGIYDDFALRAEAEHPQPEQI